MGVMLGVEGSGNHSHAMVVDAPGTLLGFGANDDPANWDDVGISAAGAAIRSSVLEALTQAALTPADVEASVLALGGVDFPMDEQRLSGIPAAIGLGEPFRILNDAFAALRAGTEQPYGVVVIAGNGTVVAGRNPEGLELRSLGMGPLFGDFGSETDISQAAVTAVALAYLDRGPQTALTDLFCDFAEVDSAIEFLEGASRGRIDPVGFAPSILRAAAGGDEVARRLLGEAGESLGATAVHVLRKLGMSDLAFDLVLAGEMFRAGGLIVDALAGTVGPAAPRIRICPLEHPPAVGAALLAMELAGRTPHAGLRAELARQVGRAID